MQDLFKGREKMGEWQKVSETDNKFLNIIGNMCGWISALFLKPHIRWGTMWTYDSDDDIMEDL